MVATTSQVERVLYRSLLRACRAIDKSPVARSLLSSNPEQLFDREQRRIIRVRNVDTSTPAHVVDSIVGTFLKGEHYTPDTIEPGSAAHLLRLYFLQENTAPNDLEGNRNGDLPQGTNPLDCAFEALRRLQNALTLATDCVNGSINPRSKEANEALASSVREVVGDDWLKQREQSEGVHAGDILLCSPVLCLLQPVFHQVAILITEAEQLEGRRKVPPTTKTSTSTERVSSASRCKNENASAIAALAAAVDATGEHQYQAARRGLDQELPENGQALPTVPPPSSSSTVSNDRVQSPKKGSTVEPRGFSGVILNRPTNSTLGDFLELCESPYSTTTGLDYQNQEKDGNMRTSSRNKHPLRCFSNNRIFKGGDCLLDLPSNTVVGNMMMLHPYGNRVPGSTVVVAPHTAPSTVASTPTSHAQDFFSVLRRAAAATAVVEQPVNEKRQSSINLSKAKKRPLEVGAPSFWSNTWTAENSDVDRKERRTDSTFNPECDVRETRERSDIGSSKTGGEMADALNGVYATYDLRGAAEFCEAGYGDPNCFFIFYGYCGWEKDQLLCELDRSIWYCAKLHPMTRQLKHPVLDLLREESRCPEMEDGVWAAAMTSIGGEYEQLGSALGGLEANELLSHLDENSVLRRYDELNFVEDIDDVSDASQQPPSGF